MPRAALLMRWRSRSPLAAAGCAAPRRSAAAPGARSRTPAAGSPTRAAASSILHGLNMVYKRPPYDPGAVGFGADDAQFLRRNGFNTIRLGLIYKAVEPQPGPLRRRLPRAGSRRPSGCWLARGIFSPDRLPPGPLQRAVRRRGLARLGGARRRPARRAADRLPRAPTSPAPALQPRLRQLLGRTPPAPGGVRPPGPLRARPGPGRRALPRASPACSATTC